MNVILSFVGQGSIAIIVLAFMLVKVTIETSFSFLLSSFNKIYFKECEITCGQGHTCEVNSSGLNCSGTLFDFFLNYSLVNY